MVLNGLVQGLSVWMIVALIYGVSLSSGYSADKARLLSFISLVVGNLGLIFTNRSWTKSILSTLRIPNPSLWWVSGGALGFLILVSIVPFLRDLFKFDPISLWEYLACMSAGVISILASESVKLPVIQKMFARSQNIKQNQG
jgi:P-type Ca2+ transporter type 2C